MINNHISIHLYNEQWNNVKKNVRPLKLLSCSPSIFLPVSLSLCILYSLFHEGKDTSAIPQLSVHHLVFVFPILFCFHKGFNNFHLSKISELIRFFTETCVSSYLLFHDASELLFSLWNEIISCNYKRNVSFLFSLIISRKLHPEIILSAIKNERSHLSGWR